jgi:hypothetical protein
LEVPTLEDDARENTVSNKELPKLVTDIFEQTLNKDMTLQARQMLESTLHRFHDVFRDRVQNDPPAKVTPAYSELLPEKTPNGLPRGLLSTNQEEAFVW